MSFVHLHTHSEYSLLDGANRLSDLVSRALHFEMPALALTDHGCLFGASAQTRASPTHGVAQLEGGAHRSSPRTTARSARRASSRSSKGSFSRPTIW